MTPFHRVDKDTETSKQSIEDEVLQEFLERIPGGLFRYKAGDDDTLDMVSTGLLDIFGCADYDEFRELTGNTFHGLVYPPDLERVQSEIEEQIAEDGTDRVNYRIERADGEIRWVDDSGRLVEDANGEKWFYVNVIDVTDRVEYRKELEFANERLELLTALSNDVLFDIQCASGHTNVYGDFKSRFGREPQQSDFVVHRRCQQECNLDINSHDLSYLLDQINENSLVDFETSTVDADGNPVWYRYQSVVLYNELGLPVRHVGRLLDTHEQAMRESQYRKKAERDGLTGLLNRATALDRIDMLLNTENRPCTLITIDVDDFKGVNDTFGHMEGDRVLKELGEFLSQAMRREDVVARMGGDEFLIFAPGLGPGPASERILEHLIRGPFAADRSADNTRKDANEASPSISVGAACCMNPPVDFEELYEAADQALYTAKDAGKAVYKLAVMQTPDAD